MAQPKTKGRTDNTDFSGADEETSLREQLKAHLNWCAYLGTTSDEEDMEALAALLRRTARTMRDLADQAERQAKA